MQPTEDDILSLSEVAACPQFPFKIYCFPFSFRWEGEEKVKSEQKYKPDRISVKQRTLKRPNAFTVGSLTNTQGCLSLPFSFSESYYQVPS